MINWAKKNIRIIVVATVIGICIVGVTMSSMAIDNQIIVADEIQGSVSAQDISINTKIPGRIVKFYVEEGQEVKAGDPVVEISSDELEAKKAQLEAQIAQAAAGVQAAEATVEIANANYELSLDRVAQAKAGISASESQRDMANAVNTKAINGARSQEIIQAQAAFDLYDATYERAQVLLEGGAISQQKFDEIKTQRNVAEQTLLMAIEGARTEDKAAAYAQLTLTQSGVAASEAVYNQAMEASNIAFSQINQANAGLVAAQGVLAQATAGLAEVNVYLSDTLLTAPIDGTVSSLNSDEGELVSTGTSIGTICNMDNCWITVNLDEDKLAGIVEGASVDVNLLAYNGQTFKGTVVTINKQPDFGVKKATNENGNFDIVSYGVKIMLENDEDVLRPGMTAVVDIGL